jgi:gluconate 2-dehydrogenase gamma chain
VGGKPILRRDVLRSLGIGLALGSVSRVIPLQAADYSHKMIRAEKALKSTYKPKFFSAHQYKTLKALCGAILPAEGQSGGAIEADVPEFIDLLTSENRDFQLKLGGGMMWLDSACTDRFGKLYGDCSGEEQTQILDLIAYRKNAVSVPSLTSGVEFFSFLRKFVADGYFTSEIGIKYLEYIGNTSLSEFPGCPDIPEA